MYPFDQRFIFAIESLDWHENPWLILLKKDSLADDTYSRLIKGAAAIGYSTDCVERNMDLLKKHPLDDLADLALLEDYRCEPAIAALKTRSGNEVMALAKILSEDESATKRALAVKILNHARNPSFDSRAESIMRQLHKCERDDLVLEQLIYAHSRKTTRLL